MNARTIGAAAVAALLLVAGSWSAVQAQKPSVPDLRDGDVVWAFANEEPFYDSRVAGALGALMAQRIEEETPAGTRIVQVTADGPGYVAATQYAEIEVEPLLAAAGFDPSRPFDLVGTCRFWTPEANPTATDIPWGTPASPAGVVISAFNDALRALNVQPTACESVGDPQEAHFVFWQWGDDAPVLSMRPAGTLLTGTETALGPTTGGANAGGGTGGGDVAPAVTGNAGLTEGGSTTTVVLATAAAALLVVFARRRTA